MRVEIAISTPLFPPSSDPWLSESKFDGYRLLASVKNGVAARRCVQLSHVAGSAEGWAGRTATSTSVARRWSVRERSPSPITCLNLPMAASTRTRFVSPDAFCQAARPCSAILGASHRPGRRALPRGSAAWAPCGRAAKGCLAVGPLERARQQQAIVKLHLPIICRSVPFVRSGLRRLGHPTLPRGPMRRPFVINWPFVAYFFDPESQHPFGTAAIGDRFFNQQRGCGPCTPGATYAQFLQVPSLHTPRSTAADRPRVDQNWRNRRLPGPRRLASGSCSPGFTATLIPESQHALACGSGMVDFREHCGCGACTQGLTHVQARQLPLSAQACWHMAGLGAVGTIRRLSGRQIVLSMNKLFGED